MGRLFHSEKEKNLFSDMMLEAGRMAGTNIQIQMVTKADLDLYHDPDYEREDPKNLDIIVDDHPQIKVLRHLHWYNENDEVLPILAYISKRDYKDVDMDVLLGAEITFPYLLSGSAGTKRYKISDARSYGPGPLYWVCRLTPVREKFVQEPNQNQDGNYEYLDIPKR